MRVCVRRCVCVRTYVRVRVREGMSVCMSVYLLLLLILILLPHCQVVLSSSPTFPLTYFLSHISSQLHVVYRVFYSVNGMD